MFVNRETKLDALDAHPGAQLAVIYGRRRVDKTTLLPEWLRRNNLPFFY